MASGSDDGTIFLTNLLSYRQELLFKHQVEIKKVYLINIYPQVLFLDPFDCLVATDSFGTVFFIGVGLSKFKQKVLLQKVYRTTSLTNKEEQFPVMALSYFRDKGLLFLGDELGNIKVIVIKYVQIWDLNDLLNKIQIHRYEDKKTKIRFNMKEEGDKDEGQNFFET